MGRLEGKIAIVTGAGRQGNIGLAICEAFLREGARGVIATDHRRDEHEAISARVRGAFGDGRFHLLEHDVTDEASWRDVLDHTLDAFGELDVLVNNAGISMQGGVETTSLSALRATMAVNHDALFLGMKICQPTLEKTVMRYAGGGAIVNNLSMSSYMPNQYDLAYSVSKAAARMLTLCAAEEFGAKKIRVNSVHPGLTMTPLIEEGLRDFVTAGAYPDRDTGVASIASMSPLNMSSQPEDTAHAFVYLASEEARFVTGASLYHDGGIARRY